MGVTAPTPGNLAPSDLVHGDPAFKAAADELADKGYIDSQLDKLVTC